MLRIRNHVLHPGLLWFLFLEIRKIFFSRNVIQCWNKFPRETLESVTLEVFRTWLGKALADLSAGGIALFVLLADASLHLKNLGQSMAPVMYCYYI